MNNAHISPLEARRHLSVSLGSDHILRIVTQDKRDLIVVAPADKSHFSVKVNGRSFGKYSNFTVASLEIRTGDGADVIDLTGLKVPARVVGGHGGDTIMGGRRNDSIFGGGGSDRLSGAQGNDVIEGGLLDDVIEGNDGDDHIIPFSDVGFDDSISGGNGYDTVDYSASSDNLVLEYRETTEDELVVDDQLENDVEAILCGSGNDLVTNFTDQKITIVGGAGDDTLIGGSNNDLLEAGDGADSLVGNAGKDSFVFGVLDSAIDHIDGGSGVDDVLDIGFKDTNDVVVNV